MYQNKNHFIIKHLDFLIIDFVVAEISFVLSYMCRFGIKISSVSGSYIFMAIFLGMIQFAVAILGQNYRNILRRGYLVELKKVIFQNLNVFFIVFSFIFLAKLQVYYSRLFFTYYFSMILLMMWLMRILWKKNVRKLLLKSEERSHLLVITNEDTMGACLKRLEKEEYQYFKVVGIVVYNNDKCDDYVKHIPIVANKKNMFDYVRKNVVDEVLLNIKCSKEEEEQIVQTFLRMGVTVHINIPWENDFPNVDFEKIGDCAVLTTSIKTATAYQVLMKRLLDIFGSLVGLVLTVILYVIFAPIIYLQSPGPIFFSQVRIGKNGRKFRIYKFRSMRRDAEELKEILTEKNEMNGLMFKIEKDPRIIPIGLIMRRYSLDEFPQFWNVLKGDMSLVGTRPPTLDEFEQYSLHHKVRLSIKPGMTGLWQVSGRSNINDFEKVVKLDYEYIENWNLRLDIKLLLQTILVVLSKKGAM